MTRFTSPHYPMLRVALRSGGAVQFQDGVADVPDEAMADFEAFLAVDGDTFGVRPADAAAAPVDASADLGPGYTALERERALAAAGQPYADADQPDPDEDDAQTAQDEPSGEAGDEAAQSTWEDDGGQDGRPAASDEAAAEAPADDDDDDADDDYADMDRDELRDEARSMGLATSGTKADLLARIRAGLKD